MEIISKSEAQTRAKALREIPDSVLEEINANIAKGYALGSNSVSYSKPDNMAEVTWRALCDAIVSKGYKVKAESCQREGQWVRIEL
jgi:hypothetical protein